MAEPGGGPSSTGPDPPRVVAELLLALLGYPGELFVEVQPTAGGGVERWGADGADGSGWDREEFDGDDREASSGAAGIQLAADWGPERPAERQLLNRLARLGHLYRMLRDFAEAARGSSGAAGLGAGSGPGASSSRPHLLLPRPSLYRAALASGLDEALESYEAAVLKLEQDALAAEAEAEWQREMDAAEASAGRGGVVTDAAAASTSLPLRLASLQRTLAPFESLLPQLAGFISAVRSRGLAGGSLLMALRARAFGGVAPVAACFERLIWHTHSALFRQLAAWCVYGELLDPHAEFFIQRQEEGASHHRHGGSPPGLAAASGREVEAHEAGGAGRDASDAAAEAALDEWHTGFCVRLEALPAYVPLPAAQAALFAGRAVRVLRRPPAGFSAGGGPEAGVSSGVPPPPLVSAEVEATSLSAFARLAAAPRLQAASLEATLASVQAGAATQLWRLLTAGAGLPAHLLALKDYFLLARGDFIQSFVEEARPLLALPPAGAGAAASLAGPLAQAALLSGVASDPHFAHVSLYLASSAPAAAAPYGAPRPGSAGGAGASSSSSAGALHVPTYDGWDGLSLAYSARWPLGLLLTPAALGRYNSLFQYLLRLKRAQMGLEAGWGHMRRVAGRGRSAPTGGGRPALWRLRQHMAHLVTNLQIYIQLDVVEPQHRLLMERVASASEFMQAESAHAAFLSALVAQTFLDLPTVTRLLDSVFALSQTLCGLLAADDGSPTAAAADGPRAGALAAEFGRAAALLFTVLSGNKLAGSARAPFLRQLLLRLNFNAFLLGQAKAMAAGGGASAGVLPPPLGARAH